MNITEIQYHYNLGSDQLVPKLLHRYSFTNGTAQDGVAQYGTARNSSTAVTVATDSGVLYGNATVRGGKLVLGPTLTGTQFSALKLPDDVLSHSKTFTIELWVSTMPPFSRSQTLLSSHQDSSCFLHLGGAQSVPASQSTLTGAVVTKLIAVHQ